MHPPFLAALACNEHASPSSYLQRYYDNYYNSLNPNTLAIVYHSKDSMDQPPICSGVSMHSLSIVKEPSTIIIIRSEFSCVSFEFMFILSFCARYIRSCRGLQFHVYASVFRSYIYLHVHVCWPYLISCMHVQAVCVLCNIALLLCNVWLSIERL